MPETKRKKIESMTNETQTIKIFYAPLQLNRARHRDYLIFNIQQQQNKRKKIREKEILYTLIYRQREREGGSEGDRHGRRYLQMHTRVFV